MFCAAKYLWSDVHLDLQVRADILRSKHPAQFKTEQEAKFGTKKQAQGQLYIGYLIQGL